MCTTCVHYNQGTIKEHLMNNYYAIIYNLSVIRFKYSIILILVHKIQTHLNRTIANTAQPNRKSDVVNSKCRPLTLELLRPPCVFQTPYFFRAHFSETLPYTSGYSLLHLLVHKFQKHFAPR